MTLSPKLRKAIQEHSIDHFDSLVALRRELHQHPELSGKESWTAALLAEKLDRLGWQVRTGMGGNGLVADWVTDPVKPTIALRVDMDALPIQETNQAPYRSQVTGVMHACGHDVHSAIGVGVAAVTASLGDRLTGNVRILFQPEEEEITGALRMIRAGALTNPKPMAIFGLHVGPFPVGQVAWTDGLFLAGFNHFLASLIPEPDFQGTLSHLDAVAERCCQAIESFNEWELPESWSAMQRFWQLMQDNPTPLQHFVVYDASRNEEDPESWHGQFGIGIKAANHHLRRSALGRIKATLNRICGVTHTAYRLESMGAMPDMRNNAELVNSIIPDLQTALGSDLIRLQAAFPFNCEDFTYYVKEIPGAMFWLGGADPASGKYAMLHTPDFDVDERCLLTGTLTMTTLLVSVLSQAN